MIFEIKTILKFTNMETIVFSLIAGALKIFAQGILGNRQNELNVEAQESANATNLSMTRETNATNYKIWQESMEYNSPSNQMRMLQEAGINPITAYGGIQSGNKATPISMEAPQVFPVMNDLMGISEAVGGLFDMMQTSSLNAEQVKNMKEDRKTKEFINELNETTKETQIIKQSYEAGLIDATTKEKMNNIVMRKQEMYLKGLTVDSALKLESEQIRIASQEVKNNKFKGDLLELEKGLKGIELMYKDKLSKAELDKVLADVNVLNKKLVEMQSKIDLNVKELDLKDQQEIMNALQIDGMAIENQIKEVNKDISEEDLKLKKKENVSKAIKNKLDGLQYLLNVNTYEATKKYMQGQAEHEANKPILDILGAFTGGSK